jgi:hypothetical protein
MRITSSSLGRTARAAGDGAELERAVAGVDAIRRAYAVPPAAVESQQPPPAGGQAAPAPPPREGWGLIHDPIYLKESGRPGPSSLSIWSSDPHPHARASRAGAAREGERRPQKRTHQISAGASEHAHTA